MRLPRFRLRTLMVAVAVAGVAIGGYRWADRMRRRSAYFAFVASAYPMFGVKSPGPPGCVRENALFYRAFASGDTP